MYKYEFLSNLIKKDFINNNLDIQKFPSERELAKRYGVSRITVRKSLNHLAEEGLITRIQGKGTFLKSAKLSQSPIQSIGLSQLAQECGYTVNTKVIESKMMIADSNIRNLLRINKNESFLVIYISRQRLLNDKVVSLEISHYKMNFAFLLDNNLEDNSLYNLINEKGHKLSIDYCDIETILSDTQTSKLLNCKKGSPLFLLTGRLINQKGEIINIVQEYMLGNQFKFSIG